MKVPISPTLVVTSSANPLPRAHIRRWSWLSTQHGSDVRGCAHRASLHKHARFLFFLFLLPSRCLKVDIKVDDMSQNPRCQAQLHFFASSNRRTVVRFTSTPQTGERRADRRSGPHGGVKPGRPTSPPLSCFLAQAAPSTWKLPSRFDHGKPQPILGNDQLRKTSAHPPGWIFSSESLSSCSFGLLRCFSQLRTVHGKPKRASGNGNSSLLVRTQAPSTSRKQCS